MDHTAFERRDIRRSLVIHTRLTFGDLQVAIRSPGIVYFAFMLHITSINQSYTITLNCSSDLVGIQEAGVCD